MTIILKLCFLLLGLCTWSPNVLIINNFNIFLNTLKDPIEETDDCVSLLIIFIYLITQY